MFLIIGEENIHYLAILQCLQETSFLRLQVSVDPLPNTIPVQCALVQYSTVMTFTSLYHTGMAGQRS